jgi:hypothetical protein
MRSRNVVRKVGVVNLEHVSCSDSVPLGERFVIICVRNLAAPCYRCPVSFPLDIDHVCRLNKRSSTWSLPAVWHVHVAGT